MINREKTPLYIIATIILLVAGIYFYNFFSFNFSKEGNVWGTFGDYFGGVLGPVLSFILIYLVVKEGIDSRKNYLESKSFNIKSQDQIDKQIQILTPKPDVVYYLTRTSSVVTAIIENIGNCVAYDINSEFSFEVDLEEELSNEIEKLKRLEYLVPKQKAGVNLGRRSIMNGHVSIPPHNVKIEFSKQKGNENEFSTLFVIDKNILETLVSENNIEGAILEVAKSIKKT